MTSIYREVWYRCRVCGLVIDDTQTVYNSDTRTRTQANDLLCFIASTPMPSRRFRRLHRFNR